MGAGFLPNKIVYYVVYVYVYVSNFSANEYSDIFVIFVSTKFNTWIPKFLLAQLGPRNNFELAMKKRNIYFFVGLLLDDVDRNGLHVLACVI